VQQPLVTTPAASSAVSPARQPGLRHNLTVQVLVAIALGVLLGALRPAWGQAMKPVGDTFINLVKMVIGPIIFLTIVLGVANMQDVRKVGRVGGKAFLYFEIVSTIALAIGLAVVNVTRPGAGIDVGSLARDDVTRYTAASGEATSFVGILTHVVPQSIVGAFANGEILQIVFFSLLFGLAMLGVGEPARPLFTGLERLSQVFFRLTAMIMRVAPIGAFGAMAYTIGAFGLRALLPLGRLMLDV
jgi:aerobic C4-dicarboxylate transport protein